MHERHAILQYNHLNAKGEEVRISLSTSLAPGIELILS